MKSFSLLCLVVLFVSNVVLSNAWVNNLSVCNSRATSSSLSCQQQRRHVKQHQRRNTNVVVLLSSPASSITSSEQQQQDVVDNGADDDDDEEVEYEEIEYDLLTEKEFVGSEWLVGTVKENSNKIAETWCRLAVDKDGKNIAIWGDDSEGTWSLDVASQFLSMSKDAFWGKSIWAGVVDDYYYVQGTVRSWSFLAAASVTGQWQAKRLGVDPKEAGTAPWFEVAEEEEEKEEEKPVVAAGELKEGKGDMEKVEE